MLTSCIASRHLVFPLALTLLVSQAGAQITNKADLSMPIPQPFLYQGRLNVAELPMPLPQPANGLYDFRFRLVGDPSG